MTIEEIKAKLKRYRFIAGEISDLLDERERLRSLAEKVTPSLSFAPVHGGDGDKMTAVVSNLVEMDNYIEQRCKDLYKARQDADKLIDTLTDERYRAVLKSYYFSRRTWEECCVAIGYSWQHTHTLHSEALRKLKEQIESDH